MSVSPVSLRRRSTAWNSSRWLWCSQSWRGAMAFTICAAAPQPFSEACRTSPAASSSLAWRSSWPLGMSSIPTSPSIPALTGFAQAIIRCIAHTQGGSMYTRGNPLGLPFPSPRCGSIPAKAGGGRLRDHHLVAGVGSAWGAAQVKVPVNQLGQSKMQGPGGWQNQPSIVDQAAVVKGDADAVGVVASIGWSWSVDGFVLRKPLSPKHKSTLLTL